MLLPSSYYEGEKKGLGQLQLEDIFGKVERGKKYKREIYTNEVKKIIKEIIEYIFPGNEFGGESGAPAEDGNKSLPSYLRPTISSIKKRKTGGADVERPTIKSIFILKAIGDITLDELKQLIEPASPAHNIIFNIYSQGKDIFSVEDSACPSNIRCGTHIQMIKH
jgi:hypothetical protein